MLRLFPPGAQPPCWVTRGHLCVQSTLRPHHGRTCLLSTSSVPGRVEAFTDLASVTPPATMGPRHCDYTPSSGRRGSAGRERACPRPHRRSGRNWDRSPGLPILNSEPLTSVHLALGSGLGIIFLMSFRLFDHCSRRYMPFRRDPQGPCQQGGEEESCSRESAGVSTGGGRWKQPDDESGGGSGRHRAMTTLETGRAQASLGAACL